MYPCGTETTNIKGSTIGKQWDELGKHQVKRGEIRRKVVQREGNKNINL